MRFSATQTWVDEDKDIFAYSATCNVRAKNVIGSQKKAGKRIADVFTERAEWWSSGPYSLKTLRQKGHPYAKRNMYRVGRSSVKTRKTTHATVYAARVGEKFPNRINVQSGDFRASWKTRISNGPNKLIVELSNDSEHARYLTKWGTTKMVPRNPLAGIMRESRKKVFDIERQVIPDAVRGSGRAFGSITQGRLRKAFVTGWRAGTAIGGIG